jgi:hypothetical protein
MSISAETYNLDWSFDGNRTNVNVFAADTAGNPIADGTVIQFSTEGGQIVTSCKTTGINSGTSIISGCEVEFNTQDFRPIDGYVRIIAWMEGEEAYKDLNANGKYDAGEPFHDTGQIFRDDDDDGAYSATFDELVIGATLAGAPGIGTSACAAPSQSVNINETPLSVAGTCDGVWGKTLIRRTIRLPVSDPRALGIAPIVGGVTVFTQLPPPFAGTRTAAPSGTTVSVPNPPAGCTITISPSTVGKTEVEPTVHVIEGKGSVVGAPNPCSGQEVVVEAKFGTVGNATTKYTFPL